MNNFIKKICEINEEILRCNVSLKNYNTMKLACNAKYFIMPTNFNELKKVLEVINNFKIKYYIIGNGSNIIFSDKEKECIIKLNFKKSKYNFILYSSDLVMIKAYELAKNGYTGLEYISNIPASIGGAIIMNAGAYNHFFSDVIEYVYYLDENLKFKVMTKEECKFSYRDSIFKNSKKIVLGCKIKLINGDKERIMNIMNECKIKRMKSQPIEFFNSGSIFKNYGNISAWELIEASSLRGYKINDAMVSEKHCNFIVNISNARNKDVISLIKLIKKEVKKKYNINLEEEVIIID